MPADLLSGEVLFFSENKYIFGKFSTVVYNEDLSGILQREICFYGAEIP